MDKACNRTDDSFQTWRDKVVAIDGDMSAPQCGLDKPQLVVVQDQVTVIINCAASTSFDDPIQDALASNFHVRSHFL